MAVLVTTYFGIYLPTCHKVIIMLSTISPSIVFTIADCTVCMFKVVFCHEYSILYSSILVNILFLKACVVSFLFKFFSHFLVIL